MFEYCPTYSERSCYTIQCWFFKIEKKRYSTSTTWLILSDGKLKSLKLNYKYKDLIFQVNVMNSKADYFYCA